MFSGPIRSGNRGGTGLFKWDDVKDDKHRENYLGHSINAPVGRWQKGKDLGWYAKNKDGETVESHVKHDEIADIKQKEADAMAEALGLKAKKVTKSTVSPAEIQRMLKLDAAANEEFNPEGEGDKKGGLGFGRIDTTTFKSRNQNGASDSESNHDEEPKVRTDAEKRQRNSDDESEPDKAEKRSKPKKEKKERKEKKEKKSKKEKRDRKEKKSKRHHTE